ncbi:MAG: hypothetical protein ACREPA_08350 [Candidatus Dormibacteraceae bacterium]
MYVRVTQLKVPADQFDVGAQTFQDRVVPTARKQPGFGGAVMFTDRERGTAIGATYWDSIDSLNASEEIGVQARLQSAEAARSEVIDVDRFEIVVFHRAGSYGRGFSRVNQLFADPSKLEAGIAFIRDRVVPNVGARNGFQGLVMGTNRLTGRSFVTTTWETAADRTASEPAVRDQREEAGRIFGGTVTVQNHELVYAELVESARV